MSDLNKTLQQYKTYETLMEFAEAQSKTILNLSKKNQKLEEERDHLKQLLESTVPLMLNETESIKDITEDDSEYICTVEIAKLKKVTLERELTLEESRRLDTYFKILSQIQSRQKQPERAVKELTDANILTLLQKPDESK